MEVITYNLATTELQMGLTEKALYHLLSAPWNEAMYFHKLAICYERLGQKEKVRAGIGAGADGSVESAAWRPCPGREKFFRRCAGWYNSGRTTPTISKIQSTDKSSSPVSKI